MPRLRIRSAPATPLGLVAARSIQQIEHHEQRRCRHLFRVRLAQPVEPSAELAVEDGYLTVEDERPTW
jgi:hypothetical protein